MRHISKVAFIKVNQLGDTVVNVPVVEALVARFGRGNVAVMTTPIAQGVYQRLIPAENMLVRSKKEFNSAWKQPLDLWRHWSWLRQFRPDAVIVPYDQGYVARFLARTSGAGTVFEMANDKVRLPGFMARVLQPDEHRAMHENDWELYRAFASWAGIGEVPAFPPQPAGIWSRASRTADCPKRVLIHPGSSREATRWGTDNYIEVATHLVARGIEVLWINEADNVPPPAPGIEILERRPLQEFAELVSGCDLFIGNNSGPMHVCDSLGVPLLIICGPVPLAWDPYWSTGKMLLRLPELACQPCESWRGPITVCVRTEEPFACLRRVSARKVLEEALRLLETGPACPGPC